MWNSAAPAYLRHTPSRRPHGSRTLRSFAAVNGLRPPEAARHRASRDARLSTGSGAPLTAAKLRKQEASARSTARYAKRKGTRLAARAATPHPALLCNATFSHKGRRGARGATLVLAQRAAPHLSAAPTSSPRKRGEGARRALNLQDALVADVQAQRSPYVPRLSASAATVSGRTRESGVSSKRRAP